MLDSFDAIQIDIDGHSHWLYADGTILHVISGGDGTGDGGSGDGGTGTGTGAGGDGGGGDGGGGTGSGGDGGKGGDADKTFTQAEVQRIAAREKAEGERASAKAIAEKLGVTPEEAAEIVKNHKEAEKKAMSEAELAKAEALEEKSKAAADRAEAKKERTSAAVERHLVRAGLNLGDDDKKHKDRLDRAIRLVDVDPESDDINAAVEEAVEDLKTDMPELFTGGTGGNGNGAAPSGDVTRPKPPTQKPTSAIGKGAERAKRDIEKRRGVSVGAGTDKT